MPSMPLDILIEVRCRNYHCEVGMHFVPPPCKVVWGRLPTYICPEQTTAGRNEYQNEL